MSDHPLPKSTGCRRRGGRSSKRRSSPSHRQITAERSEPRRYPVWLQYTQQHPETRKHCFFFPGWSAAARRCHGAPETDGSHVRIFSDSHRKASLWRDRGRQTQVREPLRHWEDPSLFKHGFVVTSPVLIMRIMVVKPPVYHT
jgi:hypothetical protein